MLIYETLEVMLSNSRLKNRVVIPHSVQLALSFLYLKRCDFVREDVNEFGCLLSEERLKPPL